MNKTEIVEIELIDGEIAFVKDTKDYKALKSKEYNFFFNKKDGYFVRWGLGNGVAEKMTKQEKDLYLLWCNIWNEKFNLKQFVSDLQTDSNYFKMVPDILDFEVSTRCDFGCDFCYKSNKDDGEYMTTEDFTKVIDKLPVSICQCAQYRQRVRECRLESEGQRTLFGFDRRADPGTQAHSRLGRAPACGWPMGQPAAPEQRTVWPRRHGGRAGLP